MDLGHRRDVAVGLLKVWVLLAAMSVGACTGEFGTNTSGGGCIVGEHQILRSSGVIETPKGNITLTVPYGVNVALCVW